MPQTNFRRVPKSEFKAWEQEYLRSQSRITYGHAFVDKFFQGGFMPAVEDVPAAEARKFILEHLVE